MGLSTKKVDILILLSILVRVEMVNGNICSWIRQECL